MWGKMSAFLFFCLPFQQGAAYICGPLILVMIYVSFDSQKLQLGFSLNWHCGICVFLFFPFFFLLYLNHLHCCIAVELFLLALKFAEIRA